MGLIRTNRWPQPAPSSACVYHLEVLAYVTPFSVPRHRLFSPSDRAIDRRERESSLKVPQLPVGGGAPE